jgi:lipoate-protein ligase B
VPYDEALAIQEKLVAEVTDGKHPAALLLLEHPHTFTFGRRGRKENLTWDATELDRHAIEVHWVDRGGDVTYHGPGQIVAYPILPLSTRTAQQKGEHNNAENAYKVNYIAYLRDLEEVVIQALAQLGANAIRIQDATGVWVQPSKSHPKPAKIAAIGVKVDAKGVSKHGFALNVSTDMRYWEGIIACGLADYAVTSLAEILPSVPSYDQIIGEIELAFGRVFDYQIIPGHSLMD